MKNQEIKFKNLNHSYSIIIGNNTLNLLPKKIKTLCPKTQKIALIIDSKIPNKFKKIIKAKLKNYNLLIMSFNANEKNKSLKKVNFYLDKILNKGCERANEIASKKLKKIHEIVGF